MFPARRGEIRAARPKTARRCAPATPRRGWDSYRRPQGSRPTSYDAASGSQKEETPAKPEEREAPVFKSELEAAKEELPEEVKPEPKERKVPVFKSELEAAKEELPEEQKTES